MPSFFLHSQMCNIDNFTCVVLYVLCTVTWSSCGLTSVHWSPAVLHSPMSDPLVFQAAGRDVATTRRESGASEHEGQVATRCRHQRGHRPAVAE